MSERPRSHARLRSLVRLPRTAIAIGLTVFLLIAGTGTAAALWTTATSSLTSNASAGTLVFSQTGADALTKVYSSGNLVDVAPITVKNTGTAPSPVSIKLAAKTGNNLANAVVITGWQVTSTALCTATPPTGATTVSASLTAGITGSFPTLAVGASVFYCVRTTVTEAQANTTGTAAEVNATLSATLGNWVFSSVATVATQSLAPDTTRPTAPSNLVSSGTTTSQTTLSWGAASDAFGVTGYRVYRAGILIATVTTLNYTNTGLVASTSYNYTVRAIDAAGNESLDSNAITVTTPGLAYNRISNPNSGLCLDAENSGTANGTKLIIWTCSTGQNQMWQFVPVADGYVKIVPRHAPVLAWDIDAGGGVNDFAKAQLWGYSGGANQQWTVQQEPAGTVRFINRNSGKCLDINGATNVAGTQLQQYTCNSTPAQSFTLTVVG